MNMIIKQHYTIGGVDKFNWAVRSEPHTVVFKRYFAGYIICHGFEGLSLITVPMHEGEARGRGQLSLDNPDVAMLLGNKEIMKKIALG